MIFKFFITTKSALLIYSFIYLFSFWFLFFLIIYFYYFEFFCKRDRTPILMPGSVCFLFSFFCLRFRFDRIPNSVPSFLNTLVVIAVKFFVVVYLKKKKKIISSFLPPLSSISCCLKYFQIRDLFIPLKLINFYDSYDCKE